MRKDLTDLTIILDRSGSMYSCKTETEGGVNQLIDDQKKTEGACTFSLAQFDNHYEVVHDAVDIQSLGEFSFHPRGGTALLDAVGKTITTTGERLAKMAEQDRPGLVTIVIVTDGHENSSKEFVKSAIKDMIERQTNEYSWQFTFLGANQDAFSEAASMGISSSADYTTQNSMAAFQGASSNTRRMRGATLKSQVVDNSYTAAELKAMSE